MKLLLALEERDDRLEHLLSEYGEVVVANTLNDAVAEFDQGGFDVVVLDSDLGVIFANSIVLIPWGQPQLGVEAMAGGAYDYVDRDNPGVSVERRLRAAIDSMLAAA